MTDSGCPALAVTAVAAEDLPAAKGVVVTAAVCTGQLTIGWDNDLVDAAHDRAVGRRDKPLATGEVSSAAVLACLVAAAVACVVLSLVCPAGAAGW